MPRTAPSENPSTALLRELAEDSPAMIWVTGADNLCQWVNRACLDFTGRTIEQERGLGWADFVHPEDRDRCLAEIEGALALQQPYELEYRVLGPGGEYRWVLDRARPRRDADGNFAGYIGTAFDVTDRRRVQHATRFLLAAGRALSSSLDVEAALQQLVAEAARLIADMAFCHLAMPRQRPRLVATAHREREQLPALESWLATTTPSRFVAEGISGPRLESCPSPLGPLALLRIPVATRASGSGELTLARLGRPAFGEPELLVAEELARRMATALEHARLYREATEANRIKDEFLATLSHELRAPLNAIVGWGHVLQQGTPDAATVARAATVIRRNAAAQVKLVSDLLDISRIVAGKLRLTKTVVDVPAVVDAAVDAVRATAGERGLHVLTRVARDAGPVLGEASRLEQVVGHLLSNALKFTPRGGEVEVVLALDGEDVRLTVQDNGPGIPEKFLPYVFERFRQADASTTRPHGGLGLGLAIARHLVEAHDGTIEAANRSDGPGARVTVRLPRHGRR